MTASASTNRSTVFLSGYPSPLYNELYADWDRVTRHVAAAHTTAGSRRGQDRTEVIWTNRPITNRLFDPEPIGAASP